MVLQVTLRRASESSGRRRKRTGRQGAATAGGGRSGQAAARGCDIIRVRMTGGSESRDSRDLSSNRRQRAPQTMSAPTRVQQAVGLAIVISLALVSQPLPTKGSADQTSNLVRMREAFVHPPEDSKIMVRWWWFGPAVTHSELRREMQQMKAGGFGGFEVQTTYPLALDDPSHNFKNLEYLSDAHLDALRYVSWQARELGLRMDLTLGSGWPYGGPGVPATEAAGRLRFEAVAVNPGAADLPLPYLGTGEKLM